MSKNRNTAIKSMTAGAFVSVVVLAIAAFLDTLINPKMANVISLLIGLVINFVLQQMVFVTNASTHLVKYIIADILILGSNQYMVSYLIDNANKYKSRLDEKLKPYYNTLSRIVVGAIIWIILSYPLRKYWVFALPPV